MIRCEELGMEFMNKSELFRALKENEERIISLKKATVYKSSDKGHISGGLLTYRSDTSIKGSDLQMKEDSIYAVINTTKYMDSHRDVHFDGIWKKSLKEQQGKIFYVDSHSLKVDDVIAWPKDVNAFTRTIPWSQVGKNYEGNTEALIFEVPKERLQKKSAIDVIDNKRDVENSVSMIYVKVRLGINDDSKDFAENKAYYDSRIDQIANREKVEQLGYFYGIEEAKIHKEGSMVLAGSNDVTPILYGKEPPKGTPAKEEPSEDTLMKREFFINQI